MAAPQLQTERIQGAEDITDVPQGLFPFPEAPKRMAEQVEAGVDARTRVHVGAHPAGARPPAAPLPAAHQHRRPLSATDTGWSGPR